MGEKNPWIIIYRQIDCAIIDKKKLIDIINNL